MRLALLTVAIAMMFAGVVSPVRCQSGNTAPLIGGPPVGFIVLPALPPNDFHAWCETPRGVCVVQGNAPIAPGSACHCAEYEGHTS